MSARFPGLSGTQNGRKEGGRRWGGGGGGGRGGGAVAVCLSGSRVLNPGANHPAPPKPQHKAHKLQKSNPTKKL